MSNGADIMSLPYHNRERLHVDNHDTNDIILCMKKYHPAHAKDYDKISDQFWKGNVEDTARGLFDFLKKNVNYKIEKEDFQTVKTPGAILHQGHGDCKHYAGFITGILDSLQRKGYPIRSKYRFVADEPGKEVHHVFAVVSGQGKTFWVDPVLSSFDVRPTFYNTKDITMSGIGAVYHISGVGIGTIEQAFKTREQVINFLRHHHAHPGQFKNSEHMVRFMAHHMRPNHRPMHPHHFLNGVVHTDFVAGGFENTNLVAGIGKRKKHHSNFLKALGKGLKKIEHGAEVNLRNAGKEIKKDADKVKHLVLKVSLSAARGPFLGLVDVNAFNLAHRLHDTLLGPKRSGLLAKWNDMGGSDKMLINAVNNGYRHYKKNHGGYNTNMKISGLSCTVNGVGCARVGAIHIAAMLALASSIIAALAKFLQHSPADDKAMADAAKDGTNALVDTANQGMQDAQNPGAAANALDQAVQPGEQQNSMSVSTGVNAAGDPVIAVHSVHHPDLPGGGGGVPADPAAAGIVDDPGDGGNVPAKTGDGMMATVKNFVTDKKLMVSLGVAGVGMFSAMQAPKKQQKQRIALALMGGAATYAGISYWQKH